MHLLPIDVSKRQLSSLKRGHPVRVKHGSGFNLLVSPQNYKLCCRAFARNKGSEIKLSPEEIEANRSLTPEQHAQYMSHPSVEPFFSGIKSTGRGIFDDLRKHPATREIYNTLAPELKELAKEMAREKMKGGRLTVDDINDALGTNMGYLQKAGIANMTANDLLGKASEHGFDLKHFVAPIKGRVEGLFEPPSRSSGGGMHHMTALSGIRPRHTGMLMGKGNISHTDFQPPALVSQPYGTNFHMQFQLPPQYHRFNNGTIDIGGKGLYA